MAVESWQGLLSWAISTQFDRWIGSVSAGAGEMHLGYSLQVRSCRASSTDNHHGDGLKPAQPVLIFAQKTRMVERKGKGRSAGGTAGARTGSSQAAGVHGMCNLLILLLQQTRWTRAQIYMTTLPSLHCFFSPLGVPHMSAH